MSFKYIKIVLISLLFIMFLFNCSYAENVELNFFYGINNIAKNGNLLPIELRVTNKENKKFTGYVNVNIYESNKSVYVYKTNLNIESNDTAIINKSVAVNGRNNTIITEVYNDREEIVANERKNIDLSYLDDRLIVGVITYDPNSISYIDEVQIGNNALRTKLVEINEEMYDKNKNIFDQIDVLLISDIDSNTFSEAFSYAITNFYLNSKPVIIGLGGKYGAFTMPNYFYKYLSGPLFDTTTYLDIGTFAITRFDMQNAKKIINLGKDTYIESVNDDNNIVICVPFSFNDLKSNNEADKIFAEIIEKGLGEYRIERYINIANNLRNNDYYNISNLLNMIDKLKLPDIFLLSALLILYLLIITIIIYVYLRNINKRHLYGSYVLVVAIIFTFVMFYFGFNIMKKKTFLTYFSIVDIKDTSTKENAFLNFRTSESTSYSFNTNSNNKIYPIIKTNTEPILSSNFMDIGTIKYTTFSNNDNKTYVSIDNAKDFDSNIFNYENSNYLNDIYTIDCSLTRFNNEIDGRITNNMDIKINDASILMFGKILKLGDIEANRSVTLARAEVIGAAVGNNAMISEIISNTNKNIVKYYLDENVYDYYSYALLFGFIDNNGTLDINSNDVGDVYGRTLLIRRIPLNGYDNKLDICSLEMPVRNIEGFYDNANNSINGDAEVINEYNFDESNSIESIYLEELSNYDKGNINYNVPFYGDISVLNLQTMNFDKIYENMINSELLSKYLSEDNKITFKFSPSSKDPLYRKLSLPVIRAIAKRND